MFLHIRLLQEISVSRSSWIFFATLCFYQGGGGGAVSIGQEGQGGFDCRDCAFSGNKANNGLVRFCGKRVFHRSMGILAERWMVWRDREAPSGC